MYCRGGCWLGRHGPTPHLLLSSGSEHTPPDRELPPFWDRVRQLGSSVGPILFQFPPNFERCLGQAGPDLWWAACRHMPNAVTCMCYDFPWPRA
jgi:hypothetical protein